MLQPKKRKWKKSESETANNIKVTPRPNGTEVRSVLHRTVIADSPLRYGGTYTRRVAVATLDTAAITGESYG